MGANAMKSHFSQMAKYNTWANARLYGMARGLPDKLYRKNVGAFFGSLHGTLNHLLVTDRVWMRRFTGIGDDHPISSTQSCLKICLRLNLREGKRTNESFSMLMA
jgi:uncharacterized damage-inducible protein DinB